MWSKVDIIALVSNVKHNGLGIFCYYLGNNAIVFKQLNKLCKQRQNSSFLATYAHCFFKGIKILRLNPR